MASGKSLELKELKMEPYWLKKFNGLNRRQRRANAAVRRRNG